MIIGWLVLLLLPFFQMNTCVFPEMGNSENRALAKKPSISETGLVHIHTYMNAYTSYFNDNFGFRTKLIHLNNSIDVNFFGISPHPLVAIGRDGWLFYNNPNDNGGFKDFYGAIPYTVEEMNAISLYIDTLIAEFQKRGITYLIVLAPNKETIYPENLAANVKSKQGERTRADQILSLMEKKRASYLDLRDSLRKAKGLYGYPLYYMTDTHWNKLGAFVGSQNIVEILHSRYPEIRPLNMDDFYIQGSQGYSKGDLAGFINMAGAMADTDVIISPRTPSLAECTKRSEINSHAWATWASPEKKLPRLLAFHDSFLSNVIPFLSDRFSYCSYVWSSTVDFSIVDQERPDIVIFEFVERFSSKSILPGS